jgi:exosortase
MSAIFGKYKKEILAGILFLLAYLPTILWMWERWFVTDSYYSHGILVPFVSMFLIGQMYGELNQLKREESDWGLRLIVIGLFIHLISSALRVYFTSGFSMLIVLYGLVLHFRGEAFFRKMLFPLLFLMFMVPLPMVVVANLSFQLKIFAAEISTSVLNNIRIPAIREGSIIKMHTAYVVVDDVCSGLRSLISLTALGSLFAYWIKGTMTRRVILFLSTIPIAIITNACRITFLSMISEIWGSDKATGFVHDMTGYMVFVLAFALLYITKKIIEQ